jgi:hypothetical protein
MGRVLNDSKHEIGGLHGVVALKHKAGELHYRIDESHERVIIQGDVNGDGKADFEIELSGLQPMQAGDFNL